MKKLNRRGFTLVELLAIIVILAIILVVTVPQIFSAVDNSKKSSLVNSAKGFISWYSTTKAADDLEIDSSKKVLKSNASPSANWECITTGTANLAGISIVDYNINTTKTGVTNQAITAFSTATTAIITTGHCSMIRKNTTTNRYEVILVAKNTGKLYMGSGPMWAGSDGTIKVG